MGHQVGKPEPWLGTEREKQTVGRGLMLYWLKAGEKNKFQSHDNSWHISYELDDCIQKEYEAGSGLIGSAMIVY